jgi:hypothetical protein
LVEPVGEVDPPLDLHTRILDRERQLTVGRRMPTRLPRLVVIAAAAAMITFVILALALAAHSRSSAPEPASRSTVYRVLPAEGVTASKPDYDGAIILDIGPASGGEWKIYADGRVVWRATDPSPTDKVQQWLTPRGVRLLRSKILAMAQPTGLFRHDLKGGAALGDPVLDRHQTNAFYDVRIGGRMVSTEVAAPSLFDGPHRTASRAQLHALRNIATLMTDLTSRLPATAWNDPTIRPYIASHVCASFDRAAPDPAKLPAPARELLAQQRSLLDHASGPLTNDQARALFAAFTEAGLQPVHNDAHGIVWRLPTADNAPIRDTLIGFGPGWPNGGCW